MENNILNYKTFGKGEPLVVLHGLFGSLDNWQSIAKTWANDYQVVLVDLPNHGKSYHTDSFSYDQMATAVLELCDHLKFDSINLLGHSMGGKTAINFAVNYPDRIKKLIVVDIAPKAYPPHHDEILEGLHSLNPNELSSRKEADEKLALKIENVGVRLFLLKNLKRNDQGGYEWKMNLPLLTESVSSVIGTNKIPFPISTPTLFVRGGQSNYILDSDFDFIFENFPNAAIETIENAGHWVHAEQPEQLDQLVTSFLS